MPLHYTFQGSGVAAKYGFDVEFVIVHDRGADGSVKTMEDRVGMLLGGEVEFISGLHHEPYAARLRGDRRFVYLAQTQNSWDDRLVGRRGVGSPGELVGKTVLVHAAAPCILGNLRSALRRSGVDPDLVRFVVSEEYIAAGKHRAVQAVVEGAADAALVDIPFDLKARKLGLQVIPLPDLPVIHNTTITTLTENVRRDEAGVVAFLKALVEAIHFFKTRREETIRILSETIARKLRLEEDEVRYLWAEWARLLLRKPYPHPLAIQNVYDADFGGQPGAHRVSPLEPWDLHYLRRIDDEGFIDRLYADEEEGRGPGSGDSEVASDSRGSAPASGS